MVPEELEDTI